MTYRTIAALAVTFVNLQVILSDGLTLWRMFGSLPTARVALLALAGGCTFTLMDIWSHAIGGRWATEPPAEFSNLRSEPRRTAEKPGAEHV